MDDILLMLLGAAMGYFANEIIRSFRNKDGIQ